MNKERENHAAQDAPAHPDSERVSPPSPNSSPEVRARTRVATGPRTAAGKAISSRNAVRFGFFSKNLFLANIAKREYGHLLRDLVADWQPVGPSEMLQVELFALFAFQLRRIFRVREGLIAQKSLSPAGQVPADPAPHCNGGDNEKELKGALKELREHIKRQEERMKDQEFLGKVFEEIVYPGADRQLERAEDHLLRHLYRATAELERLQHIRLGENVIPPVLVQVERT
jgi:hypothetical protein